MSTTQQTTSQARHRVIAARATSQGPRDTLGTTNEARLAALQIFAWAATGSSSMDEYDEIVAAALASRDAVYRGAFLETLAALAKAI